MNTFLSHLVARVTGEAPVLHRRQPALFEPREISPVGQATAARHVESSEGESPGMAEELSNSETPMPGQGLERALPNASRATMSQAAPRVGSATAASQAPAHSTIQTARGIRSDALSDVRPSSLQRRAFTDALASTSDVRPVFREGDFDLAPADFTVRAGAAKHDESPPARLQSYAQGTRDPAPRLMPERSARREQSAAMNAPETPRAVTPELKISKQDALERRAAPEARQTGQYVSEARRATVNRVSRQSERAASESAPIQVTIGCVEVRAEVAGSVVPHARRSRAPSVEDFVRSRARRPT